MFAKLGYARPTSKSITPVACSCKQVPVQRPSSILLSNSGFGVGLSFHKKVLEGLSTIRELGDFSSRPRRHGELNASAPFSASARQPCSEGKTGDEGRLPAARCCILRG